MVNLIWALLGIAAGGGITYYVTTRFIHRPKVHYSLRPAAFLDPRDFSSDLTITHSGNRINNLAALTLEVSLRGQSDVTEKQVTENHKPTLYLPGFNAIDVKTLNNDQTKFDIPLGIAGQGSLIVINIKRLRAGSTAIFQIVGSFSTPRTEIGEFQAEFYPGAIINVNTITSGSIKRPWKTEK